MCFFKHIKCKAIIQLDNKKYEYDLNHYSTKKKVRTMNKIFALLTMSVILFFSKDIDDCEANSEPYMTNGITSYMKGENLALSKALKNSQLSETSITQKKALERSN